LIVTDLSRGERLYASPLLQRLVPDRVAVAAARLVGEYQWRKDPELRQEARGRMKALLAETPRAGEAEALAKQHVIESRVRGVVFWRPRMQARARLEGLEHLREAAAARRGVVIVSSHIGANALAHTPPLAREGWRMQVVGGHWLYPPYRGYDGLRGLRLKERVEREGSTWIRPGDAHARLEELLRRGEVCVIPFDLPGTHRATFLGKTAWLRSGLVRLAEATGARLVPMFVGCEGHRLYARVEHPIDPADHEGVDDLMDLLADRFSEEILSRPAEREGSWFLDSLWEERSRASTLAAPGA
jgi:lauroyl/myristoyl acyltransferase